MAIHATSAVLAIAAVIAIALCFVFIITLAIRKSNKKGMRSYKIISRGRFFSLKWGREKGEEKGEGGGKEGNLNPDSFRLKSNNHNNIS